MTERFGHVAVERACELADESGAVCGPDAVLLRAVLRIAAHHAVSRAHAPALGDRSRDRFRSALGVGVPVGLPPADDRPLVGHHTARAAALRAGLPAPVGRGVRVFPADAGPRTAAGHRTGGCHVSHPAVVRQALEQLSVAARRPGRLHRALRHQRVALPHDAGGPLAGPVRWPGSGPRSSPTRRWRRSSTTQSTSRRARCWRAPATGGPGAAGTTCSACGPREESESSTLRLATLAQGRPERSRGASAAARSEWRWGPTSSKEAPAAAASERSESSRSEWGWGPTSSKERSMAHAERPMVLPRLSRGPVGVLLGERDGHAATGGAARARRWRGSGSRSAAPLEDRVRRGHPHQ